ncbi:LysR family transcriptional regulator [Vibrio agarivorans]|uniref:LysR family transcriptional regulator n=1 Tax=Vibrio agarivorans TaxID=153622 RepID=UPI0025B4D1FD|nr:LysR family transcriptional regulator [Vibrio agarivorans]MDN3661460.1 LysR family transcriptional regulator [Vibrio agarivorans]
MPKGLNYNLLRELVLIYRHRNLKKVAVYLGVTESAVSKHLSHLREHFDDPLFVRTAEGLEPTFKMIEMISEIEQGLDLIDQAIVSTPAFSAKDYDGEIKVALHTLAVEYFAEPIYEAVRERFPHAKVGIKTWSSSTEQDIIDGRIHVGVNFLNVGRTKSLYQKTLLHAPLVIAIPSSTGVTTWEKAFEQPFVFYRIAGWNDEHEWFNERSRQFGINLDYKIYLDNLTVAKSVMRKHGYGFLGLPWLFNEPDFELISPPEHLRIEQPVAICCRLANRYHPLFKALFECIEKGRLVCDFGSSSTQ